MKLMKQTNAIRDDSLLHRGGGAIPIGAARRGARPDAVRYTGVGAGMRQLSAVLAAPLLLLLLLAPRSTSQNAPNPTTEQAGNCGMAGEGSASRRL